MGGKEPIWDEHESSFFKHFPVDGDETFDQCIMGMPGCGGDNPCPLHFIWGDAKERMLNELRDCTLREIKETVVARQKLEGSVKKPRKA